MTVKIQYQGELQSPLQSKEQAQGKETDTVVALVDTYMELRNSIADKMEAMTKELAKEQAQMKQLETDLRQLADESFAADEKGEIKGTDYVLKFGPKAIQVVNMDLAKMREILGMEQFLDIASVSVTHARQYLNPKEQAEVLLEERRGARSLKPELC